ncbi:MAG: OmpA family protein [Candidatus Omnitrophica bacterium]|nr:OmpA family protein [Candidatus Omnitrophota bacterium]
MKIRATQFFIIALFLAGCASTRPEKERMDSLTVQLESASHKFELAKRENLNLKKELILFKKYQDIDTARFIAAQADFEKELAGEISAGEVWIQMTDRGLIVVIDAEKLFVSASNALSDPGKEFLGKITGLIGQYFVTNYIYIEGHTDNQSLAVFEWKSDWEFSFARALSILKYFTEKKGMDPLRFSASGFGQYRPRASNDTKEGRRLNRRIEIVISPQKTVKYPKN